MVLSLERLRVSDEQKLENSNSDELFQGSFLRNTLNRSKIVSQIISYICLYAESDPLAKQAKQWFQNPTKNFDQLENSTCADEFSSWDKLMAAKPEDETIYGEFLSKVFADVKDESDGLYNFPIFNKDEIESGAVLKTDGAHANGYIQDSTPNNPNVLTGMIPFPSSPQFSEATLTKEKLSNWFNDRDRSNYTFDNSYIPCTS